MKIFLTYLESIACVGMIPMACPNAGLVTYQGGHLVKLLIVHITITIQVKHAESYFKMAARGCNEGRNVMFSEQISSNYRSDNCIINIVSIFQSPAFVWLSLNRISI